MRHFSKKQSCLAEMNVFKKQTIKQWRNLINITSDHSLELGEKEMTDSKQTACGYMQK